MKKSKFFARLLKWLRQQVVFWGIWVILGRIYLSEIPGRFSKAVWRWFEILWLLEDYLIRVAYPLQSQKPAPLPLRIAARMAIALINPMFLFPVACILGGRILINHWPTLQAIFPHPSEWFADAISLVSDIVQFLFVAALSIRAFSQERVQRWFVVVVAVNIAGLVAQPDLLGLIELASMAILLLQATLLRQLAGYQPPKAPALLATQGSTWRYASIFVASLLVGFWAIGEARPEVPKLVVMFGFAGSLSFQMSANLRALRGTISAQEFRKWHFWAACCGAVSTWSTAPLFYNGSVFYYFAVLTAMTLILISERLNRRNNKKGS